MESVDKIWAGIISAITGTGVYLSAVADFLIAGPILGVVAGFTLSYVVQTKTQKRAWKREFLLKNIDRIYGPLYNESLAIESQHNFMVQYHSYSQFQPQTWNDIKQSYVYHMIEDESFRRQLDEFYLRIETFNENVRDAKDRINEIVKRIGTKYYGVDVERITLCQNNEAGYPVESVNECLLFNRHPKKTFEQGAGLIIQVIHRMKNEMHRMELQKQEDCERFELVWKELTEEASKFEGFETVRKTARHINIKNLEVREKLVKRIGERQNI